MRIDRPSSAWSALAFGLATAATALWGRRSTKRGLDRWYRRLEKPPFQPPKAVFGPVWGALYGAIGTAGLRVYRAPPSRHRSQALALWGAQLGLNGLWSWLFFGRHRPELALIDSALLLATAGAFQRRAARVDRLASRLFVPYVAWLSFATLLNTEIVRRNVRQIAVTARHPFQPRV